MISYIDELVPPLSPNITIAPDSTSAICKQIDYIVLLWLYAAIYPEILKHVLHPGVRLTIRETWVEIKNLFHNHINIKYMPLKLNFKRASKGSHSMANFLNYIKSIANSLHVISTPVANDDVIL